jgi:hypothetical protein
MPKRRLAAEVVGCARAYMIYDRLRDLAQGSSTTAQRDAAHVVAVERVLGLFHEARLQSVVVRHRLVTQLADGYYGWIHFAVPIVVAVFLLWKGGHLNWVRWRSTFFLMCALGLAGFWLFPVAPPRFLPSHFGFVDTMTTIGGPGIRPQSASDVGNAYAAMPSLHAGWSLWSACVVWSMTRDRLLRGISALHVVLTTLVIMLTANHYLLDAVAGWCCLGVAWFFYEATSRTRIVGFEAGVAADHHATGRVGSP